MAAPIVKRGAMDNHPPFRAEHIGSLLRPGDLLALRQKFSAGEIARDELAAAENLAIKEAVGLQQRLGLKLATDGEFRRRSYHSYFYAQLGDVAPDAARGDDEVGPGGRVAQPAAVIRSKLKWTHPIHVDDFKLLKSLTAAVPKITIPGPCALHFRGGDQAVTAHAYHDADEFWTDTVEAYHKELAALASAGCVYVQIDETAFAKFADPAVQARLAARGDDWRALIDRYVDVTNRVLRGANGMHVGMHLCRGNRGGRWHAEGSYDLVADKLFNALDIGFYFLEYDSPRAGDFSPLRFVPKSKSVVLGLVSTKTEALEERSALARRIEEASQYVDLDRLALSPQCGFASSQEGNPISPAAQAAKLGLVVMVAQDIWGNA
jgi:5-methyltetrahydropteroyltriglutamate--homocysteine methyltransferase